MRITVNGGPQTLPEGASVTDAAALVGIGPDDRGVAAALDGVVIPRAAWSITPVSAGATVEIVRAAAGG